MRYPTKKKARGCIIFYFSILLGRIGDCQWKGGSESGFISPYMHAFYSGRDKECFIRRCVMKVLCCTTSNPIESDWVATIDCRSSLFALSCMDWVAIWIQIQVCD